VAHLICAFQNGVDGTRGYFKCDEPATAGAWLCGTRAYGCGALRFCADPAANMLAARAIRQVVADFMVRSFLRGKSTGCGGAD
jgi:hypothetical protein